MRRSKLSAALRQEQLEAGRARTPEENFAEALRLGDEAIRALQSQFGISRAEAVRRIEAQHQIGRRPSAAARR